MYTLIVNQPVLVKLINLFSFYNRALITTGLDAGRYTEITLGGNINLDIEVFKASCCAVGQCDRYESKRPITPVGPPDQTQCKNNIQNRKRSCNYIYTLQVPVVMVIHIIDHLTTDYTTL